MLKTQLFMLKITTTDQRNCAIIYVLRMHEAQEVDGSTYFILNPTNGILCAFCFQML